MRSCCAVPAGTTPEEVIFKAAKTNKSLFAWCARWKPPTPMWQMRFFDDCPHWRWYCGDGNGVCCCFTASLMSIFCFSKVRAILIWFQLFLATDIVMRTLVHRTRRALVLYIFGGAFIGIILLDKGYGTKVLLIQQHSDRSHYRCMRVSKRFQWLYKQWLKAMTTRNLRLSVCKNAFWSLSVWRK